MKFLSRTTTVFAAELPVQQPTKFDSVIARHSVRCAALCAMLFALCVSAEAEQQKKLARLGYLTATSRSVNPGRVEAFRQGLRELGYIEAKNIAIEWRFAEWGNDWRS
jgi:hypothetical protein